MKLLAKKHSDGGFVVPEFDDREWNRLPSWRRLRDVLNDAAHESEDVVGGGQREFVEAVLRLTASLPVSSSCDTCRDTEALPEEERWQLSSPVGVEDGRAYYVCPRGHAFACSWSRCARSAEATP